MIKAHNWIGELISEGAYSPLCNWGCPGDWVEMFVKCIKERSGGDAFLTVRGE